VEAAETDSVRLKALELLAELDRERPELPERPDVSESYADDPEALARLVELHVEHGLFDSIPAYRESIEHRALEIVEERAQAARAAFAVVDAQEAAERPEAVDVGEEPSGRSEAVSEPENGAERPSGLTREEMERPWRRHSLLREIPSHRARSAVENRY
jgi:hypothetical protein